MAFGDVGGAVTELVITCRTVISRSEIGIKKGDAVVLIGNYEIDITSASGMAVFGEALADVSTPDTAVPIKIRGISIFKYDGSEPIIDGVAGVVTSSTPGKVKAAKVPYGDCGLIVKVDAKEKLVHVLL